MVDKIVATKGNDDDELSGDEQKKPVFVIVKQDHNNSEMIEEETKTPASVDTSEADRDFEEEN